MENNLNDPINIEFYGLPGSGKSTISHIIAEKLKNRGCKVFEPSFDNDHLKSRIFRRISKLCNSIVFMISNHKKSAILVSMARENNYRGINMIKQIVNIAYKAYIYNHQKSNCIYIWDEGIIQSALSLSLFNDTPFNKNYNCIRNIIDTKNNAYAIYIKVSPETSIKRLDRRCSNESRVEKLNDKDLRIILNNLYTYLDNFSFQNVYIADCNNSQKLDEIEEYINYIIK